MKDKAVVKEKEINVVELNGKKYQKEAFMIEESHPAVGRILIIDGMKYKVLDEAMPGPHRSGTFIKKMTEDDDDEIKEYDDALEELSEKLVDRVDIKRLIKENIKTKPLQEIKTGLFILKAQEDGEEVDEEHHKGCYNYKIHFKNHTFDFATGEEIPHGVIF